MKQHKPVLFLDVDRTLIDTEQFYAWLGDARFGRILDVMAGKIEAPDFSAYLYPDTLDFLRAARATHRIVLLTYTVNPALQRKKLKGAGLIAHVDDVIFAKGDGKGLTGKGSEAKAYLARLGHTGFTHIFVDDAPENIAEVKAANPAIRCIRIDRTQHKKTGNPKDAPLPDQVVSSLTQLLAML